VGKGRVTGMGAGEEFLCGRKVRLVGRTGWSGPFRDRGALIMYEGKVGAIKKRNHRAGIVGE